MPSISDRVSTPPISVETIEDLRRKGLSLRSQGLHKGAAEAFAELLSLRPQDARTHVDLAISLRAMGQAVEALQVLNGALDDACSVSFRRPCILQIARCHQTLGNFDTARNYFEDALRLASKDMSVLLELAALCSHTHDLVGAQRFLSEAASVVTTDVGVGHEGALVNQKAEFEWLHGDLDMAIELLRNRARSHPDFPIMRRLISYLARRGRPREAMAELQTGYAIGVFSLRNESCLAAHVEVMKLCGDISTAIVVAEYGLIKFPQSEALRISLSELHMAYNNVESAQGVLSLQHKDLISIARAQLLSMQGESSEARSLLHYGIRGGKLSHFQKCKSLRTLFRLELFSLNLNASKETLEALIQGSSEQHLNALLMDRQKIFERNQDNLSFYQSITDIHDLCNHHLKTLAQGFDIEKCAASWMFINKVGKMRRWWSLSLKALLSQCIASPQIPANIVHYWEQNNVPDDVASAIHSWKEHYPDFQHYLYNKATAESFLAEQFPAELLARFNLASHPAMRSDIFRMAWLFVNGGFYIDADELCISRSPVLFLGSAYVSPIYLLDEYETRNNFIGATSGNSIVYSFLKNLMDVPESEFSSGLAWWLTGPGHLSWVLSVHIANRLLVADDKTGGLDVIMSPEATLLPSSVLDTVMMSPRLKYKQGEMSWQRARSKAAISAD